MVRKTLYILWIVIILLFAYTFVFHLDWVVAGMPKAGAQSLNDKYDGDCTGTETAGRCADKCPNPTDTLQGYDKETGAAVCRSAPTGCPYGDSIPVDSPKCAPPNPLVYNQDQTTVPDPDPAFVGK